MELISLTQLIDIEFLQQVQDRFSDATGFASVIVDYSGSPITKPRNFSLFCSLIRENPEYLEKCHQCDAFGGLEAARKQKPYIYICHAGLVDFAIPIIVNGQFLGAILVGQARVDANTEKHLDTIVKSTDWEKKNKEAIAVFNQVPISSIEKIQSAAETMFLLANNLVNKNVVRLVQEELRDKNNKLIEQKKDKELLEKTLKDRDTKFYQTPLNPYFLFKIVNTASRLSIIEQAPRTEEFLYTLVDFLNYSMKNINHLVRLDEEIAHVENYLMMQLVRMGRCFEYEITIQEEMKEKLIPSLILQAIVDNAVIHALELLESGGKLSIRAFALADLLVIEIGDNGAGIPEQQLEKIKNESLNPDSIFHIKGIGLGFINQMLTSYYGDDYKLMIETSPQEGTIIKVRIPITVGSVTID